MSSVEPDMEDLFQEKKRVRNPLVPLGALMTAGVLTAGLISFRRGNSQLGQVLMRARVVVQGATVALMVGTAYYYGDNPWDEMSCNYLFFKKFHINEMTLREIAG